MLPAPSTPIPPRTAEQHQALRLRRFGMASSTYALGLVILALCWQLSLFPGAALAQVAALFLLINLGLLAAFATGWNERFDDPSLTAFQVCLGVTVVAVIQVLGRDVQFVAAPFYSVLFVFGMLKLRARDLAGVAAYVLASYGVAMLLRYHLYADALDLRVEVVSAALVVASSVWFAVAASYINKLRARLRSSLQQIAALATRDALTGLSNRRQIDLDLAASVKHAQRHGGPLCVALVDVDHFKSVNDRFGHTVGDEVLISVAGCLAGSLRAGDHVGRFGGEEFLLILPATTMAQASLLVERLRARLEALHALPSDERPVTASFGLAAWRGDESAADLVRRADRALYRAKNAGRNRVVADTLFGAVG
jgi:diguanylate cyclase (GGDEF)-like protein